MKLRSKTGKKPGVWKASSKDSPKGEKTVLLERKPLGKPLRITPELIERIEGLAGRGMNREQIAYALGTSPATLDRRRKDSAEIEEAIKKGKAKGIAVITNALFTSAQAGNLGAQCFYLKNQAHWRDRVDTELTGPGGGPIQMQDMTEIGDAERAARIASILGMARQRMEANKTAPAKPKLRIRGED